MLRSHYDYRKIPHEHKKEHYLMKYLLRLTSHFLIAVLFTFVFASLAHSQFVLSELSAVNIDITLAARISMSLDDLLGLFPIFTAAIALSLILGFGVVALIRKFQPQLTSWLYPAAGAVAMLAMLLAMHPILDITLIAGARSTLGIIFQSLAGLMGGWLFMRFRKKVSYS
ncbi:MAG: hypothetical protein ACI88A_002365 [Paraglaciecola sp.]